MNFTQFVNILTVITTFYQYQGFSETLSKQCFAIYLEIFGIHSSDSPHVNRCNGENEWTADKKRLC